MFVRFRSSHRRLQLSLVETHREGGKVRHEHVASLGAVEVPSSIHGRLTFWAKLPDRLARLANRITPEDYAKILGAVHARVPMVTPDEQRSLQEENAKDDERFWTTLQDMHAGTAEGHKQLIALADKAIAASQAGMAEASTNAAVAKERIERLARGETVAGGFGKPMTREDFIEILRKAGFGPSDFRRMDHLLTISRAGGNWWDLFLSEFHRRRERAANDAARDIALLAAVKGERA